MTVPYPIGATVTADELDERPHPVLARLRAAEPVSWLPAFDGWLVTRHDLVRAVLTDPAGFTVDDPRFSTARIIGPSMLSLDGAAHARHRGPFARPFRPAPVRERFTVFVRDRVAALIDGLTPPADVRAELAGPLAVATVAEALGLGALPAGEVRAVYRALVAAISELTAGTGDGSSAAGAYDTLRARIERVLDAGSGTSLLADAVAGQRDLSRAEIVADATVLMFGGIDTAEGMIGNAVLHLLAHPDQLAALRADPALLPGAIDESLRYEPAAAVLDRYATGDIELAGASIARGDLVRVSLTAAGRDPAVFSDPDRFDIRRPNAAEHLSFARGPHFCFGAPLAVLETTAALTALLALPALRPAAPLPNPRGLVFRKPDTLPITWDAP